MPRSPSVSKFIRCVTNGMDTECPATQDAVDRLVAAESFRGRKGMLEVLNTYSRQDLCRSLLEAWRDEDLSRATGFSRDYWLGVVEGEAAGQADNLG